MVDEVGNDVTLKQQSFNHLYSYLIKYNLKHQAQSGFRKFHSGLWNLPCKDGVPIYNSIENILTIGEQLCETAYNQALGMLIVLRLLKQATVDQC